MNTVFETLKGMLCTQPDPTGPELYNIKDAYAQESIRLDAASAEVLKNLLFYLSLVFRYPGEQIYSEIQSHLSTFSDFFADYAGTVPELPPIEDLQAEYIGLFVNNQGFVPATPYASCYQGDGLLISNDYYRLRQIMAGSGIKLAESVNELEDHLAVLLEFSSNLIETLLTSQGSTDRERLKTALALLEVSYRFIFPVLDDFTDRINSYAQYDFYKVTGTALKSLFHQADPIYLRLLGLSSNLQNEPQG